MTWYLVAGVVVAALLYRILTAKIRKAANTVADEIGVKRRCVDEMLGAMGPERGNKFVQTIHIWGDPEHHGAYTLVVYEILKNDSAQNVRWWRSKLRENNINPDMSIDVATVAFMYLRDAGADSSRIKTFLDAYNSAD